MNCPSCAAPCPDTARFCPSCGYALPRETVAPQAGVRYETCVIQWDKVGKAGFTHGTRIKFWAQALGPNGEYSAGESEVFDGKGTWLSSDTHLWGCPSGKKANDIHRAFVSGLAKEGWELTGRGDYWWNTTFRRLIR